ncbi:hypothetical protein Anapl_16413 [Anas platyrhynchos]|uniref:Uncharacterized protein n=1 Tax=Anas platyrhynchos TaxID=8839 RepID=R0KLQ7_ANAPL|nr:hypothetical protein Anapl_16413 [Anas platyrhynchos]
MSIQSQSLVGQQNTTNSNSKRAAVPVRLRDEPHQKTKLNLEEIQTRPLIPKSLIHQNKPSFAVKLFGHQRAGQFLDISCSRKGPECYWIQCSNFDDIPEFFSAIMKEMHEFIFIFVLSVLHALVRRHLASSYPCDLKIPVQKSHVKASYQDFKKPSKLCNYRK